MKGRKVISGAILVIVVIAIFSSYVIHANRETQIVLDFGIFSGNLWDVPSVDSYKYIDEAIEKFERENPGVKVKYRPGTLKSDYSEWLSQKIIKGEEPDVFCVLPGDFNTLASIGIMKNLDGLVEKDKNFDINKIYDNAVKLGQLKGIQYAMPKELNPMLMFVNKTLLDKEGIPVPDSDWDWNDFYNICMKVTKDLDGDRILDQFGATGFTWQLAAYTNGQQLFDTDGKNALFDKPEVLDAVKFVQMLYKINMNQNVSDADFERGCVAFAPFRFSEYMRYKTYPYRVAKYNNYEWGCIKLPRGADGKNAADLSSSLFCISSRTQHEKEAWNFLKFLIYDEEIQLKTIKYSHSIPVLKGVTESDEAKIELNRDNPDKMISVNQKMLSEIIEQSVVTPRFHKYEKAMDLADKELFQIINGDYSPLTNLTKINRELEYFLIN